MSENSGDSGEIEGKTRTEGDQEQQENQNQEENQQEDQQEEEDQEEEEDDNYEYVYSSDENDDCCGMKRPLEQCITEEAFSPKRKYLDADGYSLRIWSEGNVIRMAIVALLRQIIDHPSNQFRILCSSDQLYPTTDLPELTELVLSIFVDVLETMTVVYELKFSTKVEMGISPPRLKCLTYCGLGTYLFPNHLLPYQFSKFINFGQLFYDLSLELRKYEKNVIPFYSISPSTSYCYHIQELCYRTQYETKAIIHTTDSSVVTGLERITNESEGTTNSRSQRRKGVGYSIGFEGIVKIDNSYLESITQLLNQISELFPTSHAPGIPNILESPLDEVLILILNEYSLEDLTRNPNFTCALLVLIGKMENFYQNQKISSTSSRPTASTSSAASTSTSTTTASATTTSTTTPSSSLDSESKSWLFPMKMYEKIARFQEIVGKDSDQEFGLNSIQLPSEFQDFQFQRLTVTSNPSTSLKSLPSDEPIEPVMFVDSFRRHTYFDHGKPITEPMSTNLLRKMRIEFSTLATSLPETIKFITLESNYMYSKFLIVGPCDTPYEGGFFIFDMKLPSDYPATNPQVNFLTTGGGTVRFNPNLYHSGKVCLSLLGTWSGEKWDPNHSNINQVLQSISYLILVSEPYFNEPGYDQHQGTSSGDQQSRAYSANIRVQTIRHAVLDHLTHPDPEFDQIVRRLLRSNWTTMKRTYLRWAEEGDGAVIRDLVNKIDRQLG